MKTLKVSASDGELSHSNQNGGEHYDTTEAIFNHITSDMVKVKGEEWSTKPQISDGWQGDSQDNSVRATLNALAEAHGYTIEYVEW